MRDSPDAKNLDEQLLSVSERREAYCTIFKYIDREDLRSLSQRAYEIAESVKDNFNFQTAADLVAEIITAAQPYIEPAPLTDQEYSNLMFLDSALTKIGENLNMRDSEQHKLFWEVVKPARKQLGLVEII